MRVFLILFLIFLTQKSFAGFKSSFLEVGAGYPFDITVTNPDNTEAYYKGVAFKTQWNYNFEDSRSETGYGISFHYKYLDIENTKKGAVKESGIHKMFGVGVFAKMSNFFLGLNYSLAKASHQSAGSVSALNEFKYNPISVDVSYTVPYGNLLEIGPGYSYTTADLSKDETGLSKDAPYAEQIIWLKLFFYLK